MLDLKILYLINIRLDIPYKSWKFFLQIKIDNKNLL